VQHLIIDADAHVTEPADVWTARVPARFRDEVPQVVKVNNVDTWMIKGEKIGMVGTTAPAGWPEFPPEYPPGYDDVHPGSFDSHARLRYMDEAGIWAQVLYPNVGGFGSENFLKLNDDELKLMCVSAYNDFLLEWCSADPNRLLPVIATPFWDIDATIKEIERCAEAGARGILFTGEPQRYKLPIIGNPYWDPMWKIATEAHLPIHFHIGSAGDLKEIGTPERYEHHTPPGSQAFTAVQLFMKNGVQCCDLITSPVLRRFPELKFVSVESGIGWLPFMLEAADYSWLGAFRPGRKPTAEDILPSDLFKRGVFVTYWFESLAPKHFLDLIPIDNVLFETDFPHTTCLFENIQETIDSGIGHLDDATRNKILWGNAARLYGIQDPPDAWRRDALLAVAK
jgi:uncharacterized protein